MYKTVLRIDKERHVYVPNHKLWVQMYKQLPFTLEIDPETVEEIPKKEWDYEGKQLDYNIYWEQEVEVVEGEDVTLTAEQYLYKHFKEVWDNN